MVGGEAATVAAAEPILRAMGASVIHTGGPGTGQADKVCNNLILATSMIAVCEAFVLAEQLGLSAQTLFAVAGASSGRCWSLTSYCPVPGPVPSSPANHGYRSGFTAAMMLKDLPLAAAAAHGAEMVGPPGAHAARYADFVEQGNGALDFSAIIKPFRGSPTGEVDQSAAKS